MPLRRILLAARLLDDRNYYYRRNAAMNASDKLIFFHVTARDWHCVLKSNDWSGGRYFKRWAVEHPSTHQNDFLSRTALISGRDLLICPFDRCSFPLQLTECTENSFFVHVIYSARLYTTNWNEYVSNIISHCSSSFRSPTGVHVDVFILKKEGTTWII